VTKGQYSTYTIIKRLGIVILPRKMALDEQIKKGGPYTKKEQDERRNQVFDLYYNKNYPMIKIANVLNVSRNTISEDVKHWQMQFAEEIEHVDISTWITSHILRLETQKIRILEQAEKNDQQRLRKNL